MCLCVYACSVAFICFDEYLGKLEGFLEFHKCDVNILAGDFNVDFSRGGSLTQLLLAFMDEWDLCA